MIIFKVNSIVNKDAEFLPKFDSIINFAIPTPQERLRLWKENFSKSSTLATDIDLMEIASKYELSGGSIVNVIRYVSLQALKRGNNIISLADMLKGISRELAKVK